MPWKFLLFGDDDEPGEEPKDSGWRTDDPVEPSRFWRDEEADETKQTDEPSFWQRMFGSDDDDN